MAFTKRRLLGNLGEDIACKYLAARGFEIIARNFLKPWGEIDIIAIRSGVYRFVEVKTISREKGAPLQRSMTAEDHIHPAKMKKLARTVELYMAAIPGDLDYQIDVIAVELHHSTRRATCKLYEQVM